MRGEVDRVRATADKDGESHRRRAETKMKRAAEATDKATKSRKKAREATAVATRAIDDASVEKKAAAIEKAAATIATKKVNNNALAKANSAAKTILKNDEMIKKLTFPLSRICSIFHFAFSLPLRWLAGISRKPSINTEQ